MRIWLPTPAKISLFAGLAIVTAMTSVALARTTSTDAVSSHSAESPSAQTCPLITPEVASQLMGTAVGLSQIIDEPPLPALRVSSLSCVFTRVGRAWAPAWAEPLIVGKRTALDSYAASEIKSGFFSNRSSGERPIDVDGNHGFVYQHDNSVELRVWAQAGWYDVHAPTVDMAKRAVRTIIDADSSRY